MEALYSNKLKDFTKTLPEECVEIDIPGLWVAPTESLSGLLPFQTGLISDDTANDAADSDAGAGFFMPPLAAEVD